RRSDQQPVRPHVHRGDQTVPSFDRAFAHSERRGRGALVSVLVYLHGFNSGGGSVKARWLREHLPEINVLSPTYPAHDADKAPAALREYFAELRRRYPRDRKLLLVGSSMGGFWARYLAP